ncbi:hypothetical protein C6496_13500 [Candidatus Poribacteria bacterium]|nr:MAG: hypothetical protein C6496_13500 [Candidatus Poribacteria bacterium]
MKYNWDQFFLRLTIVVSAIAFIVMVIVAQTYWIKWRFDPSYLGIRIQYWVEHGLYGLLGAGCVWGIYFTIRWICLGLKK